MSPKQIRCINQHHLQHQTSNTIRPNWYVQRINIENKITQKFALYFIIIFGNNQKHRPVLKPLS